ncbi:hypothetical protein C8R43DRAFT_1136735 [Mycena crocata]|nr:hypothetical protein C8R43DRAFT_1136735 [Mycena crocata]
MANTGLIRLNKLTTEFETLSSRFEEHKETTDKKIKILRVLLDEEKARTLELRERVVFLEEELGVEQVEEEAAPEVGTAAASEKDGPEGEAELEKEPEEKEKDTKGVSALAKGSKPIKDVVNKVFAHLMGVDKLNGKGLPDYPYGIGEDAWPKDAQTQKPVLRFVWKNAYSDQKNKDGIEKVITYIKVQGTTLVPQVKDALGVITDAHLKEKVISKWKYMQSEWKKVRKEEVDQE